MAYKIVRSFLDQEGNVHFTSLRKSTGSVLYEVGKPTKPWSDCGPLAAFKTLRDVEIFKQEHGWRDAPVFKCRVRRDTMEETLFITDPNTVVITFERSLPWGTVLCKEIILTKRIS